MLMLYLNGNILAKSAKIRGAYVFGRWWCGQIPSSIYDSILKRNKMCFSGVLLGENINTLSKGCFVDNMAVSQWTYNGYMSICLEISKEYGNDLAMLGSLSHVYCLHE